MKYGFLNSQLFHMINKGFYFPIHKILKINHYFPYAIHYQKLDHISNTFKFNNNMEDKRKADNEELRKWMKQSGCFVNPAIQIPAYFDGVQGIGTKQSLPHKTVILAIPSKLVITVPRCYIDPQLKSLFKSNDDLFDYESDEDAEFNILCVFLMYHKMNIQKSPWSVYLKTIAEPETGVSWPDKDLAGLNKSVIQQILHVRQQCKKVQHKLCSFLSKSKQFKHLPYEQLLKLFRICYPTVLTRCFGYYFSTACMIPIADLMNHGCETIDHQLIHLTFEQQQQFDVTYQKKHHKLNCELMGLPKANKQTVPFRLQYLLKNQLIQNDMETLAKIRRKGIDEKIYQFLNKKLHDEEHQIQKLDFCEQDDEEDNDTDDDQQYGHIKNLQHIKNAEKQQMVQFQKYYLQVQKMGDVEKRIRDKYGDDVFDEQNNKKTQKTNESQVQACVKVQETQEQSQNNANQESSSQIKNEQEKKEQSKTQVKDMQQNQKKANKIFPNENMCPIQLGQSSSSENQSCSQEEEWCLDQTCYFTMSTYGPVNAGSQLFNSYGSRTNKFLLVWYGFTYPNNLYDSVTLRLQANFPAARPKVRDIVLDTYVGGQGLCFKKNEEQYVKPEEVSREFRLKRTRLPLQFLMFLRLMLINYYEGSDNYKLLCTIPSSLQFQLQLLQYFKQIVMVLYERYPVQTIKALKQLNSEQKDEGRKSRTNFKIIYLEQQRKILDENMEGVNGAITVIQNIVKQKNFSKNVYKDLPIQTIRKIKQYIIEIKNNYQYIMYSQEGKFDIPQLQQPQ